MTCHRVPMSPSLCTCGVVLDTTQWHGEDDIGNDLCPTCSGCGCEPNERNERVTDPTDTPSTDGAPDPEEVIARWLTVWQNMEDPDDPEMTVVYRYETGQLLDALAAAGLRVVPEDRPAPCPYCNDDGVVHTYDGIVIGPCDCVAGVPTLDDDTRREVEVLIEQHQWAIDREHPCSGACLGCGAGVDESCDPDCGCHEGEMGCDTAQVLEQLGPLIRFAAAYLGGTDGR